MTTDVTSAAGRAELRRILAEATPEPWDYIVKDLVFGEPGNRISHILGGPEQWGEYYDGEDGETVRWEGDVGVFRKGIVETDSGCYPPRLPDAKLICAARSTLPAALDRIEELTEALTELAKFAHYTACASMVGFAECEALRCQRARAALAKPHTEGK